MIKILKVNDLNDRSTDCVVAVNDSITNFSSYDEIETSLKSFKNVHPKLDSTLSILPLLSSEKTLIFSPVGSLNDDFDDARRLYEAANVGIKKAVELGFRKPLLVLGDLKSLPSMYKEWAKLENVNIIVLLGAMFGAYVPIEVREDVPARATKVDMIGVLGATNDANVEVACGLEEGRRVARDIGGSDPERMAAPRIADFVQAEFKGTCVNVTVEKVCDKKYPLMAAVNRAASLVPRHEGRVVRLEYRCSGDADETVIMVGKGITYDTGGADIKAGGVMAGMHRDKCGAAAVVGFFKSLAQLKPRGLHAVGLCAFVRNSVGQESYVADEIITSRAGRRIRVGNTDAEGRMAMADLLCEAKEIALTAVNPSLYTVATLTGHVLRAYGDKYTAVLGNGPSVDKLIPQFLQAAGDLLAEPVEISTIRREDVQFHRGFLEYDDVLQCNNAPSSMTARGHQSPAAFMILASGLDFHSRQSGKPLPYTHVDCAGSAGGIGALPTAAPMLMLAARFILPRLCR